MYITQLELENLVPRLMTFTAELDYVRPEYGTCSMPAAWRFARPPRRSYRSRGPSARGCGPLESPGAGQGCLMVCSANRPATGVQRSSSPMTTETYLPEAYQLLALALVNVAPEKLLSRSVAGRPSQIEAQKG